MQRVPVSRIKLLVSVRSVLEAQDAAGAGADIIDIKEPARGPLGRADGAVIDEIACALPGGSVLSVALGELASGDLPVSLPKAAIFAKMGLLHASSEWRTQLAAGFARWPHVRAVAVAYADRAGGKDHPALEAVVEWAIEHRAAGVLLDTTIKDGRHLFDFLDEATITRTIGQVRAAGLFIALAGSLREDAFKRALDLGPDIVAVRGAACHANHRQQSIDPDRIRALLKRVKQYALRLT